MGGGVVCIGNAPARCKRAWCLLPIHTRAYTSPCNVIVHVSSTEYPQERKKMSTWQARTIFTRHPQNKRQHFLFFSRHNFIFFRPLFMQPSARVDPSYDDFMHSMLTTEKTVIPNPISLSNSVNKSINADEYDVEAIDEDLVAGSLPAACSTKMSKRAGLVLELATHITTLLPKIFSITTSMILQSTDVDTGFTGDFDDLRTLQGDIEDLMKIVEDEADEPSMEEHVVAREIKARKSRRYEVVLDLLGEKLGQLVAEDASIAGKDFRTHQGRKDMLLDIWCKKVGWDMICEFIGIAEKCEESQEERKRLRVEKEDKAMILPKINKPIIINEYENEEFDEGQFTQGPRMTEREAQIAEEKKRAK